MGVGILGIQEVLKYYSYKGLGVVIRIYVY